MAAIFLGLGSNLGDRFLNLRKSVDALSASLTAVRCSGVYESPALLKPGAPEEWNRPFLNMALAAETSLAPEALLALTQSIETKLGRPKRHAEWSPRVIDIDILTYDAMTINTPALTVPHPRMKERAFVFLPLIELGYAATPPADHATTRIGNFA